ncbi:MAG TPA: RNA polymerase sigma factor SigJ [Micromonosporaceae bacterium]
MSEDKVSVFQTARPRLFRLAYRLLGEATEAEDVLQDAFLRWAASDGVHVAEAWLTTVVTNLCLNRLTSARARRETYVGPWLPEPVFATAGEPDPAETAEQRDSLSFAALVLLERLNPPERAAFVLREAFEYSHREIGEILGVDEPHARQLYARARAHVGEPRKRFDAPLARRRTMVERFLAATVHGDLTGLERLLSDDVVAWSDGGGKATAARRPIAGRSLVAGFLVRLGQHPLAAQARYEIRMVGPDPAVAIFLADSLVAVMVPEVVAEQVVAVRTILNPDKLAFAASQAV